MSPRKSIEIALLGQVFRLRCPEGEEYRLRKAAELVEAKIGELTKSGGIVDSLRLSLMVAFHLAYEILDREENSFRHSTEYERIQKRLKSLAEEIETSLSE
jgi:cell division protein ZapA